MTAACQIKGPAAASKPVDLDLMKAIYRYQADWLLYLAASLEDDDAPRSYKGALKTIEEWTAPATSRMEAAEAIRLAIHFYEIGDSEVIPAMMMATLGFLEGGAS